MQKYHRGERRLQRARLLHRFIQRNQRCWGDLDTRLSQASKDAAMANVVRYSRKQVNCRKWCRCPYCVNRRLIYGNAFGAMTFQEVRELARGLEGFQDALADYSLTQESVQHQARVCHRLSYGSPWRYGRIYATPRD